MNIRRVEHMAGGKGHVIVKDLVGEKELHGKCGIFSEVVLEPGCSLGYHEHHNDSEIYYILQGLGEYNENGTVRSIKPGDVLYLTSGNGHEIANAGVSNLVFIALTILD